MRLNDRLQCEAGGTVQPGQRGLNAIKIDLREIRLVTFGDDITIRPDRWGTIFGSPQDWARTRARILG